MGATATRIAAGLLAIYLLWGSTFLGIHIAVDTIPPLHAAAMRWLLAGGLLYAAVRPAGGSDARAWLRSGALALLTVAASNGGVTWAETRVASGLAAVAIATVAPWLVVLEAVRPGGRRPNAPTVAGVALGLAGIALLADPRGEVDLVALGVLLASAFAFALGTTIARVRPDEGPPPVALARQMLAGGVVLLAVALLGGERLDPGAVSAASAGAVVALALLGSVAGFSIYFWLVRVAPPALVGTYACANPIVALTLGAWFADEPLTSRAALSAALVIAGVALVTLGTGPLRGGLDWWRRATYPVRAGGADGADHDRPRGLVDGPGAAAAQAR